MIFKVYTTYGENEKDIMYRVVLDIIEDVSTKYTSSDFFEKRPIIQDDMQDQLKKGVNEKTFHIVDYF